MKTSVPANHFASIVGGDPGMVLAGGGNTGGSGGAALGALAGMGIGIEGGPMAVVTIGLPAEPQLSMFDKSLINTVSGAAGFATTTFVGAMLEGAALGSIAGPAGWLAGAAVGAAVYYGTTELLQHAANETAYAGHVRRAIP